MSIPWLSNAGIKPDFSIFPKALASNFQPLPEKDVREIMLAVEQMKHSMKENGGNEGVFFSSYDEVKAQEKGKHLTLVLNNLSSMGIRP